jgi:tetratricopeptide (TPR) repeat protein
MAALLLAVALALSPGSPATGPLGPSTQAPDAESAAFAEAFAFKKSGKTDRAAEAFEAIAQNFENSPRVGEALCEAGVAWFGLGRDRQMLHRSTPASDEAFTKASEFFSRVARDRPQDLVAGRAQYMLGSTALFLGDLTAAEDAYGAVMEKFPRDPKYVPKSLERRAAVWRHLLQGDLALTDMQRYLKEFPKGEEAESVERYLAYEGMNGKPAPPIVAETWIQGEPTTFADLRGRVVGVYFFATWCEKCAKEMPFLRALDLRLRSAGFVLLGALDHSRGQTLDSVKAYFAENDLHFPAMMVSGHVHADYRGRTIPDLVLLDKQGHVRWHDHPANLTDYTIETLLGEEPDSHSPVPPK